MRRSSLEQQDDQNRGHRIIGIHSWSEAAEVPDSNRGNPAEPGIQQDPIEPHYSGAGRGVLPGHMFPDPDRQQGGSDRDEGQRGTRPAGSHWEPQRTRNGGAAPTRAKDAEYLVDSVCLRAFLPAGFPSNSGPPMAWVRPSQTRACGARWHRSRCRHRRGVSGCSATAAVGGRNRHRHRLNWRIAAKRLAEGSGGRE